MKENWTRAWEKSSHVLALALPVMLWLFVCAPPGLTLAQEEKAPASSTTTGKPKDPLSTKKGGTREVEKANAKDTSHDSAPSRGAKAAPPTASHTAAAGHSAAQTHSGPSHTTAQSRAPAGGSASKAGGKTASANKSAAGHGSTPSKPEDHPK